MTGRFERIRVVLVNTTHPGNIGAAARALKNMGLSRLYLVYPKDFPSERAVWRAANALDVLDAEQEKLDAELALLSARHDVILAEFDLLAATGQMTWDVLAGALRHENAPAGVLTE